MTQIWLSNTEAVVKLPYRRVIKSPSRIGVFAGGAGTANPGIMKDDVTVAAAVLGAKEPPVRVFTHVEMYPDFKGSDGERSWTNIKGAAAFSAQFVLGGKAREGCREAQAEFTA